MASQYETLLCRLNFTAILEARQRNLCRLLERLAPLFVDGTAHLMTDAPERSGLYLPILINNRDSVQRELISRRFYCPAAIWPEPPEAAGVCPVSHFVTEHMLSILCDQRYTEADMDFYELLDRLGVEYARVDHEHADTIEACHEIEKLLGCEICKNLFLTNRQMTEVWLLLMPGEKPFKTKLLSKQIGSARLSFASAEQMLHYLDITPGSVSVLGLMNDKENKVRLLIDRDLLTQESIGMHPCINTSSLRMKTEDLTEKLLPAMAHEPTVVDLPWDTE